jgi:hypothetical protein
MKRFEELLNLFECSARNMMRVETANTGTYDAARSTLVEYVRERMCVYGERSLRPDEARCRAPR